MRDSHPARQWARESTGGPSRPPRGDVRLSNPSFEGRSDSVTCRDRNRPCADCAHTVAKAQEFGYLASPLTPSRCSKPSFLTDEAAAGHKTTLNKKSINNAGIGTTTPENTVTTSGASLVGVGTPAAYTATATGNIDRDGEVDQWLVNDMKLGLDTSDVSDL